VYTRFRWVVIANIACLPVSSLGTRPPLALTTVMEGHERLIMSAKLMSKKIDTSAGATFRT
jgi:hypothetical protein